MPNESLISGLEQAQELYSQRQKSANKLERTLKDAVAVLAKTNRSLGEYGEQNSATPPAALPQAQQFVAGLRLREEALDPLGPDLRREVKALTGLSSAIKDALVALRAEPVDVVRLGRALAALRASRLVDRALSELLPELEQELQHGQRSLGASFGAALRDALAAQGIALGGRPPDFEIGPFALRANFVQRSAMLSYGQNLVNHKVPLNVEAAVKAYQAAQKLIMGRSEDGPRWIEQLHTAWETVRRKRGTSEPRANIVECYLEMVVLRQNKAYRVEPTKSGFVEYTRAQFAYDFVRFTQHERYDYRGLRAYGLVATKSTTDNPERSMHVVEGATPHAGGYLGDVKFDKDEANAA